MAYSLFLLMLAYLMARNHGEGLSTRSKKRVETPCQPSARYTSEKNENTKREDFKMVVVYENIIEV